MRTVSWSSVRASSCSQSIGFLTDVLDGVDNDVTPTQHASSFQPPRKLVFGLPVVVAKDVRDGGQPFGRHGIHVLRIAIEYPLECFFAVLLKGRDRADAADGNQNLAKFEIGYARRLISISIALMPCDSGYLARFKADVISLPPSEVFGRYILPDACMGATDIDQRSLRELIASNFEVELKSIIIVGSAKLGFTLRRKQKSEGEDERPAFSPFSENSDIDVAIVSDALFDKNLEAKFRVLARLGVCCGTRLLAKGQTFPKLYFQRVDAARPSTIGRHLYL
jgi:hypothetical protein